MLKTFDKENLEQAIQDAVPVDDEQIGSIGNEPLFVLCRHLRAIDWPKGHTVDDLKQLVKYWYKLSKDKLVDEDEEILSFAECWSMFLDCWEKVRYPKFDYLELAKKRAKRYTKPRPEIAWCDDIAIQYLAAVCYELQQLVVDESFFLSSYNAAEILGKSQPRALAIMKMLERSVLRCTKRGTRGKNGKASEYRYRY